MRCQLCQQHRSAGAHYRFYYGHRFPAQAVRFPPSDRRFIYSLDGQQDVWICHVCLGARLFFSLLGAVALLVLAGLSLALLTGIYPGLAIRLTGGIDPALLAAAAGLAAIVLLLVQFVAYGTEWLRVYGDELAINTHRDELQQAGYALFATRWLHDRQRWGR